MRSLAVFLLVALSTGPALAEAGPQSAPKDAQILQPAPAPAPSAENPRPWSRYAVASASAGLGAAGGYLLALPLGVALIYALPVVGLPPVLGALPFLLGVPLGAGLAAATFADGVTPLGAAVAGASALLVTGGTALVVLAVGLPLLNDPSVAEPRYYDAVVLALVTVPALAGGVAAAVTAPLLLEE